MHVSKTPGDVARLDAIQKAQSTPAAPSDPVGEVRRTDAVQISDAGRALSSDEASEGTASSDVDPRRADEIRSKILAGAYNANEMADQVARAILRSGDL